MRGVIAAGSVPTADAGAAILERGGHAVDAAVAACFATAVGEPTLTSLGGAGLLMVRDGHSGEATLCDFFADAPRKSKTELENADFFGVDLDFGPTTQRFHIGAAAAAVPGVIPGLCLALERWGTMPLSEVVKPACAMLREGFTLGPYQSRAAKLLEPILTLTEGARAIFQIDGRMMRTGDTFRLPQLADTLEALARHGWKTYYDDVLCKAMVEQFGPAAGGVITAEDLASYRVQFRQPLSLRYHHSQVMTPPPPAAGGPMIALMLRLLHTVQLGRFDPSAAAHVRLLAVAMTVADQARGDGVGALDGDRFAHWLTRFDTLRQAPKLPTVSSPNGPPATTHVSVIDAEGNAAAVTFSYGEGNGHIIGSSGIMMNNLMGEEDLFPAGFDSATRGERLPTMMSPTLLVDDDGGITALGTGGANRIRTAIVQVISLLQDHGYDPERAVTAARLHFEAGVLNAETFDFPDGGDALEALGAAKLVRFPEHNLFFGGVHMVRRAADGTLGGAGDPRRGGVMRVVRR